ncbi:MAG: hypothetical protein C0506_07030 [Anaerolinea sp.]|nr:hypothetical protein [Anaerolinea sp.]
MVDGMNSPTPHERHGYRRLSGQDAAFLSFEGPGRPMHIGAVAFVDAALWRDLAGGFHSAGLVETLIGRARAIPGLDHRLGRAPLSGWPVWQRDPALDYRRCVILREPAASRQDVRDIAESAMATPLDRALPLWRVLVVPGLDDGNTFALVFLAHHALVDGIAGMDLLTLFLDPTATSGQPETARLGSPPTDRRMLFEELARWIELPARLAGKAFAIGRSRSRMRRLARRTTALVRTCFRLLSPGPTTALRGSNEGSRTVAWFNIPERPLLHARKRLHGSPNDLVLAAVAQALTGMGGHLPFRRTRAAVPVSFRKRSERYELGNRIGLLLTPLELRERHSGRRVASIRRHTTLQKRRGDAEGYEVLTELTAWTGQWSQRLLHWLAGTLHSYGILVTNVPGPSRPYTLGGAELSEIYPLVPLFGSQSVSVAVVRYRGSFRVGVTASWPDRRTLETFTANLQVAFADLTRATAAPVAEAAPRAGAGDPAPGRA